MGLIRIIIYAVVFALVYALVRRIIMPLIFPPRKRDYYYTDRPARNEGDVTIERNKKARTPNRTPDDGDYVEYEEVE